jgi:ribosomal protein L40E
MVFGAGLAPAPGHRRATMRSCPRCSCGTEKDSVICGSCGAVLRAIAVVDDVIESVICGACGAVNPPASGECRECGAAMVQSCPRCRSDFSCTAPCCPGCGLERQDFYEESCDAADRAETTRRRNAALGQLPFLVFGTSLLVLGLWHHAHGAAVLRDVALIVGAISVAIWIGLRLVR